MKKNIHETLTNIMRPHTNTQEVLDSISESYRVIQKMLEDLLAPFKDTIKEVTKKKPWIRALIVLGKVQYVEWEYFGNRYAKSVAESKTPNKLLLRKLQRNQYASTQVVIDACVRHIKMKPYKRLFRQAIESFEKGQCELAVIGLTAVVDGLVSAVTDNPSTDLKKRIDPIMERIDDGKGYVDDRFFDTALVYTYGKMIETFSQYADFRSEEPILLNRHWIMHGRSTRRVTKLDCIKVIRLIYGTLLISDLIRL